MTNVFVQNFGFYRARFSIQSLFKTTPCPLKHQRENHTGVLASDSSHEYTVDRRSKTHTQTSQAICTYVLPASKTPVNQKSLILTPARLYPAQTRKRTKKELRNSYVELPTSGCSILTENNGLGPDQSNHKQSRLWSRLQTTRAQIAQITPK